MLASEQQVEALVELFKSGTKLNYKGANILFGLGKSPSAVFYIEMGWSKLLISANTAKRTC